MFYRIISFYICLNLEPETTQRVTSKGNSDNLKYLYVKISNYGNQNHEISSVQVTKKWGKDLQILKIRRFKNEKKILKTRIL